MIYEIFSISNYLFIVNNKLNNHLKFIIIEKPAIFYFAGLLIYLPQQFLYFFPDPQGVHLKLPCNFFLLKWAFLLKMFNNLLLNCKKVMSIFLTQQFKRI